MRPKAYILMVGDPQPSLQSLTLMSTVHQSNTSCPLSPPSLRLNMEVDLQSLFGIHVTWCAQLHSLAEAPQSPASPRSWTRITRALLVSKDRRHLLVTPASYKTLTCLWPTAEVQVLFTLLNLRYFFFIYFYPSLFDSYPLFPLFNHKINNQYCGMVSS